MHTKFKKLFLSKTFLICIFLLIAIGNLTQVLTKSWGKEPPYKSIGNYVAFENSFKNLLENVNLYQYNFHVTERLYKYSPTFSLFMAPFHYMNVYIGVFLWSLLNISLVVLALLLFPFKKKEYCFWAAWVTIFELTITVNNEQSNGIIAGLILFAFIFEDRGKIALATLMIALAVFVKPFAIVAFSFVLITNKKIRFILFSVLWMVLLFFLPLVVISYDELIAQYLNWATLLQQDSTKYYNLSVMGVIQKWTKFNPNLFLSISIGVLLFLSPFIIRSKEIIKNKINPDFKKLTLVLVLLWVIVFNHMAESSTFIIAMCGIAVWAFRETPSKSTIIILVLAIIFTSVLQTDIIPKEIRSKVTNPLKLKALFPILILVLTLVEMSLKKKIFKA